MEINKEWIERLIHIASCPSSYSEEYLRGYILSAEKLIKS